MFTESQLVTLWYPLTFFDLVVDCQCSFLTQSWGYGLTSLKLVNAFCWNNFDQEPQKVAFISQTPNEVWTGTFTFLCNALAHWDTLLEFQISGISCCTWTSLTFSNCMCFPLLNLFRKVQKFDLGKLFFWTIHVCLDWNLMSPRSHFGNT